MSYDYHSWEIRTESLSASFESIPLPPRPTGRLGGMPVVEAYSGVEVVSWYGNIERQQIGMEQEYRNQDNNEYADKIHNFLLTWRNNPITGSMNVETLEVLEASSSQLAVDSWKLANYYSNLRDQLRKLIASQEELPIGAEDPTVGAAPKRGAKRSPRPPADFGPNATPPGGAPAPGPGEGGEAPPLPV
jgi:hypothetical protein